MGLDVNGSRFLLFARGLGADFAEVLTLGRQGLHLTSRELGQVLSEFGCDADRSEVQDIMTAHDGFADGFLRYLGARSVTSLDRSPYEGAGMVHDLNVPVPEDLHERYSLVLDGGTLEHVFDVATALRNCMRMVRTGGHFLCITPTNNFMGHGFYQFSPELFFSAFSEQNGFHVERMVTFDVRSEEWYDVRSPTAVGSRVGRVGCAPAYLMVMARRFERRPTLEVNPLQSDYVPLWDHDARSGCTFHARHTGIRRLLPLHLKRRLKRCLGLITLRAEHYDPTLFKRLPKPATAAQCPARPQRSDVDPPSTIHSKGDGG